MREQLSTFYSNGWSISHFIRNFNNIQARQPKLPPILNDRENCTETASSQLETFTFYTNNVQKLYQQTTLFECVLKQIAQFSLKNFSITTLKNDSKIDMKTMNNEFKR